MMPRWIRPALWSIGVLVAGTITNLTVAWARCTAMTGQSISGLRWSDGRSADWTSPDWSPASDDRSYSGGATPAWANPMFERLGRNLGSFHLKERVWTGRGLTLRHIGASKTIPLAYSIGDSMTFGSCEAGWPWPAWAARFELDGDLGPAAAFFSGPPTRCTMEGDAGNRLRPRGPAIPNDIAWPSASQTPLPMLPLWPGAALNSLCYGGFWGIACLIPRQIRRTLRRHRGDCMTCGYSRKGIPESAACPECGSLVGTRSS